MWWNGPHMSGWEWIPGFGLMWGLFWVLVIVLVVALLRGPQRRSLPAGPDRSRSSGIAILEERYARGEIQRDEYLQKRHDLEA